MKKILAVFAEASEAVKLCPLIDIFSTKEKVRIATCYAGQNIEEIKPVLDIYNITPDYMLLTEKLDIELYDRILLILKNLKGMLDIEKPDLVLIEGGSTNSFLTAMACYHRRIPIGHLGAGLRTYDVHSSFPEEFNRQAISIITNYNFVPTRKGKMNLIKEGKDSSTIYITGNTAIDVLRKTIRADYTHPYLEWANGSKLILLNCSTKNIDENSILSICKAARSVADELTDVKILFPFDKDKLDTTRVEDFMKENERLLMVPPLAVDDYYNLINKAYFIITDSEEIQVAAPSLGKPVLVIKEDLENIDGISVGNLKLIGTNEEDIVRNCKWLVNEDFMYNNMSKVFNPFGDGYASDRIADIILTGRRWEWNERSSSQLDFKT